MKDKLKERGVKKDREGQKRGVPLGSLVGGAFRAQAYMILASSSQVPCSVPQSLRKEQNRTAAQYSAQPHSSTESIIHSLWMGIINTQTKTQRMGIINTQTKPRQLCPPLPSLHTPSSRLERERERCSQTSTLHSPVNGAVSPCALVGIHGWHK